MRDIKSVKEELASVRSSTSKVKDKIDSRQKKRHELLVEVKSLNIEYAFLMNDLRVLETEFGELVNADNVGQTVVVDTAREKGRS